MSYTSLSSISEKSRGPLVGRPHVIAPLTFSSSKAPGRGGNKKQIALRISDEIAKQARLFPGDRVDILVDTEKKSGIIHRVKSGGYSLSVPGIKVANILDGKYYPLVVKMTHYAGMPINDATSTKPCEEVTVVDEGVAFKFPADTHF